MKFFLVAEGKFVVFGSILDVLRGHDPGGFLVVRVSFVPLHGFVVIFGDGVGLGAADADDYFGFKVVVTLRFQTFEGLLVANGRRATVAHKQRLMAVGINFIPKMIERVFGDFLDSLARNLVLPQRFLL